MAARKATVKFDFKKIVLNTVIAGGVGAATQIIGEVVDDKNADMVSYGAIGAGVILPMFIHSPEVDQVGNNLIAVGAYKLAKEKGLANKMGLSGIPDDNISGLSIGAGWTPTRTVRASRPQPGEPVKKNNIVS